MNKIKTGTIRSYFIDINNIELSRHRTGLVKIFYHVKRFPVIPVLFLLPIVVCGLFGSLFYPHDPIAINLSMKLQPPAWMAGGDWSHVLGTDSAGRDLLSRLIQGSRVSLTVAVFGVAIAGFIGVVLGMLAGYLGGGIDNVIMRIVDTWMSVPAILLIILLSTIIGGGLFTIIAGIAIVFWTGYTRVIRGEVLSLKHREFVSLATVTGCGRFRILVKHIFPNIMNTVIVLATLQLGGAILMEAGLTFLGIGIQPPDTAWGLIISEGRIFMSTAWWIPTFPGFAIMITVMGSNFMGDWLRDKLDPRLRQL